MRQVSPALVALIGVMLSMGATGSRIHAQPDDPGGVPAPLPAPAADTSPRGASLRELKRRYFRAVDLIRQENYSEGVRLLQSILDTEEDDFFSPEGEDSPRETGLKFETLAQLAGLPAAGRETYERQYGPAARRLLGEAVATTKVEGLAHVTRHYFHTQAGYEAVYRLAAWQLDHGQPLAAGLSLERLRQTPHADDQFEPMLSLRAALCWRRAGDDTRAVEILTQLRSKQRRGTIAIGEREVPLFDKPDRALAWLDTTLGPARRAAATTGEQWPLFRGNVARNATSSGGSPHLHHGWRASTFDGATYSAEGDAALLRALQDRRPASSALEELLYNGLPAFQPLIVQNLAVVRGLTDLRAYHVTTGKLAWATGDKDQYLLEQMRTGGGPQAQVSGMSPLSQAVAKRAWSDATWGTISSDGELVFCIEDLGPTGMPHVPGMRLPGGMGPREFNRLVAYDVATGRAVWEAGGAHGDGADPTGGMFFLGAPLVLDGRLYSLAEQGSEVRLLALDPRSGELQWSQMLAELSATSWDITRRDSALSPSYEGGILVCPVGTEQVVAVDLTGRSLLWRYRLRNKTDGFDARRQQVLLLQQQQQRQRGLPAGERNQWFDPGGVIAGARVLFTPRDSNDILCLNLVDGSLAWKEPRGDALFVAGVHEGKVLLVGKSFVQALHLADGKPAWSEPATVPVPSGRGFLAGDYYYLPLSSAEVASLDVRDGRVVARARSPEGRIPGNLAAVRGVVISQGVDFVEGYQQLETLESEVALALEKNPLDAQALSLRGEIHLHRGDMRAAYADLQRALEINSDDGRVRELLLSSLLEGLRVDFAAYRDLQPDIERLLSDPIQRSNYYWLQAQGLLRTGERAAAFQALLRFTEPKVSADELERVDATLVVRRDRLVRARLEELLASSPAAEQRQLQQALAAKVAALAESPLSPEAGRFLEFFGRSPVAAELQRRRLELASSGDWLAEEFRLQSLAGSADPAIAAGATAQLVRLLLSAERPEDASLMIARLEKNWPEAAIPGGRTPRELASDWKQRPELARLQTGAADWPLGKVEHERLPVVGGPGGMKFFPLPIDGDHGPFFSTTMIEMDARFQSFVARDGLGRIRWKVSLEAPLQPSVYQGNRAYIVDHLVLVAVNSQLIAFDTLGTADLPGPRILWRMALSDLPALGVIQRGIGQFRKRAFNPLGEHAGTLGPMTRDYVSVLRGNKLSAIDTLTGAVLWTRDGVAPGSELFGDEEFVLAAPPEAGYAAAYRALDGEFLGIKTLPTADLRLDAFGRQIITWKPHDGRMMMALFDPIRERDAWQREFSANSRVTLVEGTEVAVLEPSGQFHILRLTDGKSVLTSEVESATGDLEQILVFKFREQYILACNEQPPRDLQGSNALMLFTAIHGDLHSFERATGKRQWSTRVEQLSLDPNQPRDLPVLVLASQTQRKPPGAATLEMYFSLRCIDRRTGQAVFDRPRLNETVQFIDFDVDIDQHQIDLKLFQSVMRLTFTDKPWPPPEAKKEGD